ncbi:glycosyltransferase family 2 protein [Methylomonas sp. SURF-2]|uniref:Glycosyltransferase family 2 protein n=1 Tax=Methylomonas subterranea TaxID=2952225 RepID=A0ABT1TCB7_9GAMM|nr:glycosyltransferase family 2 protein [Methylomonas sp. SURF-2]MCQ8103105.1 glycosyltransferase family 2 protein [Methylomonas sp. SURF-2]
MISVVIPAYNEQGAIHHTVNEIRHTLESMSIDGYEIIVVNDGSTDNTAEEALESGAKVVNHPHNVGYGKSLKSGILAANNDAIVITDADLTYPFDQFPKLYEEYVKGFDMVVGRRTGVHVNPSILKSPLRRILRFLVEFTAGRKIPDINSGLRVFSKKTVVPYFNLLCDTFSFTTSLTLAYMMTGLFVSYIDIPYSKRHGSSKVRLFRDSLRTLQFILQAVTYYNPIKVFLLFAIICILLSCVGFLISTFLHINAGYYLGLGGFLVSLIILCMGLIADLLKQIMHK